MQIQAWFVIENPYEPSSVGVEQPVVINNQPGIRLQLYLLTALNPFLFAGMTNVLAFADLYKEPIDGLSVDRVVQEITHKDMSRWAADPTHMNAALISQCCLESCDKEYLRILHDEKLTGPGAAAAAPPPPPAAAASSHMAPI